VKLSTHSLGWLRGLHTQEVIGDDPDNVVDSSCAVGLMAHTTPAWTEQYAAILDRLIEQRATLRDDDKGASLHLLLLGIRTMIDASVNNRTDRMSPAFVPGGEAHTQLVKQLTERWPAGDASRLAAEAAGPGAWERWLAAPLETCPQVVGVDFPTMALDRAEWIDGNLHLGLAPNVEDSATSTSFRVVGAEPRIWDLHGIENARMESTMSGLNVRVPMVKADVTLIRSSY